MVKNDVRVFCYYYWLYLNALVGVLLLALLLLCQGQRSLDFHRSLESGLRSFFLPREGIWVFFPKPAAGNQAYLAVETTSMPLSGDGAANKDLWDRVIRLTCAVRPEVQES